VHLSARRAREINSYYHSLGEGLGQYTPPLVDSSSNKPLSIALEEIAAEKIVVQRPGDALRVAEELLGAEQLAESGDADVVTLDVEHEAPVDETSADEAPVDGAPADAVPDAPVDEAAGDDTGDES
jgi:DNA-directed RNA polymerase subunit omega